MPFLVHTAGPNTALIKSTGAIVIGARMLAVPIIQRVDTLALHLRTITVRTAHGTTVNGVAVDVTSCCQVKIQGWSTPTPSAPDRSPRMPIDYDAIRLAAQHFIGKKDHEIDATIQKTVEGHQRAIIGALTVEQLYSDRAAFSARVKHLCLADMRNMGLAMVSYTVADIADEQGYVDALGVRQTEKVKREATEGAAHHRNLARAKQGESLAAAHMQLNVQQERIAQSDKRLQVAQADAQKEIDQARAVQEQAADIASAEQDSVLLVARQQAEAAETEAERHVIATRVDKERHLKEIHVNIPADAQLYQNKIDADILRVRSAAEAERIREISVAEAAAIRAKGKADMKILEERVKMWNECGNAGALLEKMIDVLPELAAEIAGPLEQSGKMVFIGSGDGEESQEGIEACPKDDGSGDVGLAAGMDMDRVVTCLMAGGSNSAALKAGIAKKVGCRLAESGRT